MKTTLLFLFVSLNLFSQITGYLGKKNTLDFGFKLNSPVFYKMYLFDSESIADLNLGLRVNYKRIIKRRLALSFELGLDKFKTNYEIPNFGVNSSTEVRNINHENIGFISTTFLPKIDISPKLGLQPIGINHQIGLGFSLVSLINQNYEVHAKSYTFWSGFMYEKDTTFVRNYKSQFVNGVKNQFYYTLLQYSLNFYHPINTKYLIKFGTSYNFYFTNRRIFSSSINNNNFYLHLRDEYIRTRIIRTNVYLNFSFCYSF